MPESEANDWCSMNRKAGLEIGRLLWQNRGHPIGRVESLQRTKDGLKIIFRLEVKDA